MNANSKGAYYSARKEYVESMAPTLSALRDFGTLEYARTYTTEEEFIKLADTIGGCVFLDVTAVKEDEILKDIARIVLIDEINPHKLTPKYVITDIEKKRSVSLLFRK